MTQWCALVTGLDCLFVSNAIRHQEGTSRAT